MARRNPGGHGIRRGEDHQVGRGESEFIREALQPKEDGWVISPVGDNLRSTGSTAVATAGDLRLFAVPARATNVTVAHARIHVTTLGVA